MKLKRNNLFRFQASMLRRPLFWAYALMYVTTAIFLCLGFEHAERVAGAFDDSGTYLQSSYRVAQGLPDPMRTPVYPLIIAILRAIFGVEHQIYAVDIVQSVVFFISIIYFQRTLRRFGIGQRWTFAVTLFYGLLSSINFYCIAILTECFAISFAIFWIWALVRDLPLAQRPSSALLSGFWLIVLIFLRPAMLCLIPVYVIFIVAMIWKYRRHAALTSYIAGAWLLVIGGTLLCYRHAVTKYYGIHTISSVSIINNYWNMREALAVRPEHTDNPTLKKFLTEYADIDIKDTWDILGTCEQYHVLTLNHVPVTDLEQAIANARADDPIAYFRPIPERLKSASRFDLVMNPFIGHWQYFHVAIRMTLYVYMLFMGAVFFWLIYTRASIYVWLLWLQSMSVFACSIVAAMNEWNRLLLPGLPAAMILFAIVGSSVFKPGKYRLPDATL